MMQWNTEFNVGIDKIDSQHQELFNRINLMLQAMKEGRGKTEVIQTLDFLEAYVIKHFSEEEALQKKSNYPKYDIQRQEHEEFKESLKKLRIDFEKNGVSAALVIQIQQKMSSWWKKHILQLDKDLGSHLLKVH
jgi:hemerythrin